MGPAHLGNAARVLHLGGCLNLIGLLLRMGNAQERFGEHRQGGNVRDRLNGPEGPAPRPRNHRDAGGSNPKGRGSARNVTGGANSASDAERGTAKKQVRRPNRNQGRADRVIAFIECLTVPSGEGQGGAFILRPWQRRFIKDVYAPTRPNGRRLIRRAILSIARKNGKTAIIAALVLAHLIGPEAIPNGEIYSAATEREQAAQVFKVARQIVEADPELAALMTIVPSTKTIVARSNGSFYRALSAEAGSKHGLNPSLVIYDELAQARDRNLFDVLDTSMAAREEPLFITISTQSNDPTHILSKLIDDGLGGEDPTTVCHLYAAPEGCDVLDKAGWKAANPALDDFRSLEDLEILANKAARMPSEEPRFRNLYLNQRVSPHSTLITRTDWERCAGQTDWEPGEPVFLALDLSAKTDLTALVGVSVNERSRVQAWFFKPADLIEDHERRDRVPYSLWVSDEHIEAVDGRAIHPRAVAMQIAALADSYNIVGLAYDRWQIDHLLREFDEIGLAAFKDGDPPNGIRLVPWGQGYKDMSPAIDALEMAIMDGSLVQPMNPVLTWNMANAISISDPAGNRKIDKQKARFRIDGAVALAMAIGLKARERTGEADTMPEIIFL
jgi:phage terminase large subunit-like protein